MLLVGKLARAEERLWHCGAADSYQRNNDLAIRVRLEVVRLLEVLSNQTMVVDFAVDGEDNGVVGVGQWLSARVWRAVRWDAKAGSENSVAQLTDADNAETLMAKD